MTMRSAATTMNLNALRSRYASGLRVSQLVESLLDPLAHSRSQGIWIHCLADETLLARAHELEAAGPAGKPLFGIPFAVKDNIDVAGLPTSNGCRATLDWPEQSAPAVRRLLDAGALLLGKSNMDQFAMGLVGTRSPYGLCPNPFNPDYIAGGSSSGSAVAVARGLASFALGTDTAGSGRVPAALNHLVGLKPTPGRVSSRGLRPSCRSLDCISLFAHSIGDCWELLQLIEGFDAEDPYSSQPQAYPCTLRQQAARIGVPELDRLDFGGDPVCRALFVRAAQAVEQSGLHHVATAIEPLLEAGRLLYDGPWVAERHVAVGELPREAMQPPIATILDQAADYSAADLFRAQHRLAQLRREADLLWQQVEALLLPTLPRPYRIAEIEAEPLRCNSHLGSYTNFVNLLGLCAIAIPVGFLPSGVPYGVSLIAPAWSEARLCRIAEQLLATIEARTFAPAQACHADRSEQIIAVCGAHMRGLPLNWQLLELGGHFLAEASTAPHYRMRLVEGSGPPRPCLLRSDSDGVALPLELWSLPGSQVGRLLAQVPAPLALGLIELSDGRSVYGFIGQAGAVEQGRDITARGGWRNHLASLPPSKPDG